MVSSPCVGTYYHHVSVVANYHLVLVFYHHSAYQVAIHPWAPRNSNSPNSYSANKRDNWISACMDEI